MPAFCHQDCGLAFSVERGFISVFKRQGAVAQCVLLIYSQSELISVNVSLGYFTHFQYDHG